MKQIKAAIYSRKSVYTGKGDSLENQLNLCKEYAEKYIGKIDEFLIYEDEGFSGGNTNRPEFQKLIKDVKQKKFEVLLCYRLDRISRNVADFSSTLELLQNNNIAFVSIKEQFDTSTPMGKAMVYIASVFAQLERETIAERIKDNMLELAKSGRWLGGQCPLGFESERITFLDSDYNERFLFKLSPIEDEMMVVKIIYDKYYESNSTHLVLKYLLSNNIKGKNGGDYGSIGVAETLRNPVYVMSSNEVLEYLREKGMHTCGEPNGNGILIYNKKTSKYKARDVSDWIAAVSKHKGIIPAERWLYIQHTLDKHARKENPRLGTSKKSILSGILKCAKCGAPMRVSYGKDKKDGSERLYYYTCTMKAHSGKKRCDNPNIRGDYLERQIIDELLHTNVETIIQELEKERKSVILEGESSLLNSIPKHIEIKKKEMRSLISQLSKLESAAARELVVQTINNLGSEVQEMELGLQNTEDKRKKNELIWLNTRKLIEALKEFKEFFAIIESLSNSEDLIRKKRLLLESAIEKITIDGHSKDVVIDLWGTKKN